jgi:hypothetical protein
MECRKPDRGRQERVADRARQLWAEHGSPEGCYGEFYFQAGREIELVDSLSKVSTAACLDRLRITLRDAGPKVPRSPS